MVCIKTLKIIQTGISNIITVKCKEKQRERSSFWFTPEVDTTARTNEFCWFNEISKSL